MCTTVELNKLNNNGKNIRKHEDRCGGGEQSTPYGSEPS